MMRRQLHVMIVAILIATPAYAQSAATSTPPANRCQRFDSPPSVIVTRIDGVSFRGTLLCLGDDVELATQGRVSRTPLKDVSRIAEPRDPVWDGAAVGVALGGLMWLLCGGDCDAAYMARATAYYGLAGLAVDSAVSSSKTIYKADIRSPGISFRFRF